MQVQALQTIPSKWPFAVWGQDLVDPLNMTPEGFMHIFVTVAKFTKWIESKPMVMYTAEQATDFFQENIFQFSIPNTSSPTMALISLVALSDSSVKTMALLPDFALVAHPRTNG